MNKFQVLALSACLLTACGGGGSKGGGGTPASVTPTPTSDLAKAQAYVNEFADSLETLGDGVADADLNGLWVEVWSDVYTYQGTYQGTAYSGAFTDKGFLIWRVVDNGSSIDITACTDPGGTETLTYAVEADGSITSVYNGITSTGQVTDKERVDFGTTHYTGSGSDVDWSETYAGDATSRWVKLSVDSYASFGTISSSTLGTQAAACVVSYESDGQEDGVQYPEFYYYLEDVLSNMFVMDETMPNSVKQSRIGNTVNATIDGEAVSLSFE